MKRVLILTTALVLSTAAFAFGGGGGGRKSTQFNAGVDAIGVHINGKTCPANQELVDNRCVDKCAEGVKRDWNGFCTVCVNENEMYLEYKGGCTAVDTTNLQCRSNADCLTTQYCKITRMSDYIPYIPFKSSCETLTNPTMDRGVKNVSGIETKHMIGIRTGMYWDAARNWCLAHGGRMASLTDFGITHCNSSGDPLEKCGSRNVGVITDGSWTQWYEETTGYYQTMVSDEVKADWNDFASTPWYWMKESYGNNIMYGFLPGSGAVGSRSRYPGGGGFVLCVVE